uniref:Uncharacterized protein n=1 Tax=Nelumbo nucifera TaxID=4432 RepID=A0A822Z4K4_NELNU|nr:TPA_asm: hypothetical protein HUJ06_014080 [Nelumbo nucifera]
MTEWNRGLDTQILNKSSVFGIDSVLELLQVSNNWVIRVGQEDEWLWKWEKSGYFSVSSMLRVYSLLAKTSFLVSGFGDLIWSAALGKGLMKDCLLRRGIQIQD